MTFNIKRGDTEPPIEKRLRSDAGDPVSLTSANDILFSMRDENHNVVVSDDTAGNVSILSAVDGEVQYEWQTGDTASVGVYRAEFVADFGSNRTRTFPSDGYYIVEVEEDLE